jgi:hypothetical protein
MKDQVTPKNIDARRFCPRDAQMVFGKALSAYSLPNVLSDNKPVRAAGFWRGHGARAASSPYMRLPVAHRDRYKQYT